MDTAVTTSAAPVVVWIDVAYPLPARITPGTAGSQELAAAVLAGLARYGHEVTASRYVEETAHDPRTRRTLWTHQHVTRAWRVECDADRRRVVVRLDALAYSPDRWTVTVDDRPQQLPGMRALTLPQQVTALTRAARTGVMGR